VLFFLMRRISSALLVILATLLLSFALFVVAPTDPIGPLCQRNCTASRAAEIRESLHLEDPVWKQFTIYVGGIFHKRQFTSGGIIKDCPAPCLGYSYINGQPVTKLLWQAIPVTASLVLGAAVVYLLLGLAMGTFAAQFRGSTIDRGIVIGTMTITSIPYFVFCLLSSLYLFGLWIPLTSQYTKLTDNPAKWFMGLLAAWVTLGMFNTVNYLRFGRASMIESLNEDYIRTARAKGITEKRVVLKHGLRATLTPIATIFGLDLAFQLTGAIFTERIFGLNGLGVLALNSFNQFDLPVIMGTVLFGSLLLVTMNLIIDVLYTFIDPRVRLS
jgi:peptide/nickel transport system permease protein